MYSVWLVGLTVARAENVLALLWSVVEEQGVASPTLKLMFRATERIDVKLSFIDSAHSYSVLTHLQALVPGAATAVAASRQSLIWDRGTRQLPRSEPLAQHFAHLRNGVAVALPDGPPQPHRTPRR
jgi:hypothetical protein